MTGFDIGPPQISRDLIRPGRSYANKQLIKFVENEGAQAPPIAPAIATAGVGLVDSLLGLGRGVQFLYNELVPFAPRVDLVPKDTYQMLGPELGTRLSTGINENVGQITEAAGGAVGTALSFFAGGSGAGAIGKAAGAPGKAVEILGIPGAALGKKLLGHSAELGRFTSKGDAFVAKMLEAGTGFGMYNFLTAEGGKEERAAAMVYGLAAGAVGGALGHVARHAEATILNKMLDAEGRAALVAVAKGARDPSTFNPSWLQRLPGAAVGSLIEGAGFVGIMDQEFWSNAIKGMQGDEEAGARAAGALAGSMLGSFMARTGSPDGYLDFRRNYPGLNGLKMRVEADQFAKDYAEFQVKQATGEFMAKAGDYPDQPALPAPEPTGLLGEGPANRKGDLKPDDSLPPDIAHAKRKGEVVRGRAAEDAERQPETDPTIRLGGEEQRQIGWTAEGMAESEIGHAAKRSEVERRRASEEAGRIPTGESVIRLGDEPPKALEWTAEGMSSAEIERAKRLSSRHKPHPAGDAVTELPYGDIKHPVEMVADRMLQSGWEVDAPKDGPVVTQTESGPSVGLRFPGAQDPVKVTASDKVVVCEVPADVYDTVRGTKDTAARTKTVRLEGDAARQFLDDLAMLSLVRRLQGELHFQSRGARELEAGGAWITQDGRRATVGLNGRVYTMPAIPKKGEEWRRGEKPELPIDDMPQALGPEMRRWLQLAAGLRKATSNGPHLDLLDATLLTAARGNAESESVRQLLDLLNTPIAPGMTNADAILTKLTPDNLPDVIRAMAEVAGGLGNAESARVKIAQALSRPPKPAAPEAKPETELPAKVKATETLSGIAGEKDWRTAPPEEARDAAVRYSAGAAAHGLEVTPKRLRELFHLSTSTARRVIDEGAKKAAEGRESEAGSTALFDPVAWKEVGKRLSKAAKKAMKAGASAVKEYGSISLFWRPMYRALKASGPAGRELSSKAVRIMSDTQANLAKLNALTMKAKAESADFGKASKPYKAARKWARAGKFDEDGFGYTNWQRLLEGRPIDGDVPEAAQRWAKAYQESRFLSGQMAKEAKAGITRDGKVVPFEPVSRDAKLMLRTMHPDFQKLLRKGGPRAEEAIRKIAERNGIDPEALMRDWGPKVSPTARKSNFEFERTIKDMPSVLRLSDGEVVNVLNATPHESLVAMENSQSVRAAVVKHLGQEFPAATRKGLGQPERAIGDMMTDISRESGSRAVGTAEALYKSIQNLNPDQVTDLLPKTMRRLLTLSRTAKIMRSALQDLPESFATIGQYRGIKAALSSLARAVKNYRELEEHLQRMGAISESLAYHAVVTGTGNLEALTNALGLPKRYAQDFASVWAGADALNALDAWGKEGRHTSLDVQTLERLDFEPNEVARLLGGERGELGDTFVRRYVGALTGQLLRGQRSRLGASDLFNTAYPFNRYFMNRTKQFMEIVGNIKSAKTAKERAAHVSVMLRFLVGAGIAGALANLLSYIVAEGPVDGFLIYGSKLLNNPIKTFGENIVASFVGGVPMSIGRVLGSVTGIGPAVDVDESVGRLSPWPINGLVAEALHAAGGTGSYKGETALERGVTWATRAAPAIRDLDFAAGWLGLSNPDLEGAIRAFYDYRRSAGIASGSNKNAPEDPEWFRAIAALTSEIKVKIDQGETALLSDPDIKEAVRNALKLRPGESVAAALNGKQVLSDVGAEHQIGFARERGRETARLVKAYDDALALIGRAYRRVPMDVNAANEMDFTAMLDLAAQAGQTGNAEGMKEAVDRLESVFDARRAHDLPTEREVNDLARVMADFPAVSAQAFGEKAARRLLAVAQDQAELQFAIAREIQRKYLAGDRRPTIDEAQDRALQESRQD